MRAKVITLTITINDKEFYTTLITLRNMFLRWMVRQDHSGIDFGIWDSIPTSELMIPLDVHSARNARSLDLLQRKSNDWKAVEELTNKLKDFDADDPIKYDYALFGMGVYDQS